MDGDKFMALNNMPRAVRRSGRPKYRLTGSHADPGRGTIYSIEGDDLVLRINLKQNFGKSARGKSHVIATSGGPLALATQDFAKDYKDLPPYCTLNHNLYSLIDPELPRALQTESYRR